MKITIVTPPQEQAERQVVPLDDRRARWRSSTPSEEIGGPRAPIGRTGVAIRWRRGPAVCMYGVALPRRGGVRPPTGGPAADTRPPATASDVVAVAYSDPRSREDGERALDILVGLFADERLVSARQGRPARAAAGRAVGGVPRRADVALHAAPRSRLPERPADHLGRRADGDRPGSPGAGEQRAAGPARPGRRRDARRRRRWSSA